MNDRHISNEYLGIHVILGILVIIALPLVLHPLSL